MNNTLSARKVSVESLETRLLFSTITVAPVNVVAGIAPTQAIFTATLDVPSATPISLFYRTVRGSAKPGIDYRQTTSHVVIPAGASSATFSVNVLPSTVTEANRYFSVQFKTPAGNVLASTLATATIIENSVLPTVNVSDATEQVGHRRIQTTKFFVGLSNRSALPITIDYTEQDVTAVGGLDYFPATGSVVIPPFQTGGTISLKLVGSSLVKPDKVFDIAITGATNATVPSGLFSRVVLQDDSVAGITRPTLTAVNPSAVRGEVMSFVLTLSAPSANDVSVRYFTAPDHGQRDAIHADRRGGDDPGGPDNNDYQRSHAAQHQRQRG